MRTFAKALRENEKGFSLIELLVVVVILGVLAAIAIPVFNNQRDKAALAAAESDVHNIGMELKSIVTTDTSGAALNPNTLSADGSVDVEDGQATPVVIGTLDVNLSPNSTLQDGDVAGDAFCLIVENTGGSNPQYAVFTEDGLMSNSGADSGSTCSAGAFVA